MTWGFLLVVLLRQPYSRAFGPSSYLLVWASSGAVRPPDLPHLLSMVTWRGDRQRGLSRDRPTG